jgi:membrane protein DedA with SNARE-associated domain
VTLVFPLGPTLSNLALPALALLSLLQASQPHAPRPDSPSSSPVVRWLLNFGAFGIFVIAIIDSSVVPLPIPGTTDLLLLLFAVHPGTTAMRVVALVALAIAGSLVGGYLTWNTGRKGGTAAFEKHVSPRIRRRIAKWIERHGSLAIICAAVLPPPIPLTPFLLAAGALGVSRGKFLASYTVARIARYSLVGWLGFHYGRQVVHFWRHSVAEWSTPILCIYVGLVMLGIGYALFKFFKSRHASNLKAKPKPHNRRQPAR